VGAPFPTRDHCLTPRPWSSAQSAGFPLFLPAGGVAGLAELHTLTMIIRPVRGVSTSHDRRDRDMGCRGSLSPDGSGPQRERCVDHGHMGRSIFDHDHPPVLDAAGRAWSAVIGLIGTWVWVLRWWRTCRGGQGRVIGASSAWVLSRRRQVLLAVIAIARPRAPIRQHAQINPGTRRHVDHGAGSPAVLDGADLSIREAGTASQESFGILARGRTRPADQLALPTQDDLLPGSTREGGPHDPLPLRPPLLPAA
jgi:hypothetical protein